MFYGEVAQLVEHHAEDVGVGGSIPSLTTRMTRLIGKAEEIVEFAVWLGWECRVFKQASTGTVYIELVRSVATVTEWLVVRVANHKQVHHKWVRTYSVSQYELKLADIAEVLSRGFGQAGDLL